MKRLIWLGCVLAVAATSRHASAQIIQVTIENLQPADGFTFSPVWLGFHDGGFDLFDAGVAVNGDIEAVAELGDSGPLSTTFNATTNGDATSRYDTLATAPGGFPGAPVFEPGESVSFALNVPTAARDERAAVGFDGVLGDFGVRAVHLGIGDFNVGDPVSFRHGNSPAKTKH